MNRNTTTTKYAGKPPHCIWVYRDNLDDLKQYIKNRKENIFSRNRHLFRIAILPPVLVNTTLLSSFYEI